MMRMMPPHTKVSRSRQKLLLCKELKKIVGDMNHVIDAAVVEGIRDRNALMSMGFKNRIIECSRRTPELVLERILDGENGNGVTMLTDYDKHGKKFAKKLTLYLRQRKIKVNNLYRRKIKELLNTNNMKTIESMSSIIRKWSDYYER